MHYEKLISCEFCEKEFLRKNIGKKWCSEICRFLSKIEKKECWIWKKGLGKDGYGMHSFNGKTLSAPRASWIIFKGNIKKGLVVCHTCDNRLCVNPDHLWLGTSQENTKDRDKKQRHANRKGENHHRNKLNNDNIYEIRMMIEKGIKQKEISIKYGVDSSVISHIKRKKRWSHI